MIASRAGNVPSFCECRAHMDHLGFPLSAAWKMRLPAVVSLLQKPLMPVNCRGGHASCQHCYHLTSCIVSLWSESSIAWHTGTAQLKVLCNCLQDRTVEAG